MSATTYEAEISRSKPGCFLFLVDQSRSMNGRIGGMSNNDQKDKAAADALNRALQAISMRCSQGEEVKDYFHIGITGYTTDMLMRTELDPTLKGATVAQPFLTASEVANTARIETRRVKQPDGGGGLIDADVDFPVWLEAKNRVDLRFGTPMCAALKMAKQAMETWIENHPDSFPPVLINITDGEAGDGDPVPIAREIMDLSTEDGNALIFNVHLSGMPLLGMPGYPVMYPGNPDNLPDEPARKLFEMSSPLPPQAREAARTMEIPTEDGARGYIYNADMTSLIQFLEIGTRASSLR